MIGKVILAGIILGCVGCGESPISVTGKVDFEGNPIPQGSIRFFPIENTPGDGAATEIVEGEYSITPDASLLAGTYRVSIYAEKETGRMRLSPDIIPVEEGGTGKRIKYKELKQYIPLKYNRDSILTANLDKPESTQNFELDKN